MKSIPFASRLLMRLAPTMTIRSKPSSMRRNELISCSILSCDGRLRADWIWAAGLEVFNNYHTPEQAVYFTSLALSKGASMTCGSDFHGKTKPRIAVGRFPSDSRFDGRLSDFVNHIHVIGRQGV